MSSVAVLPGVGRTSLSTSRRCGFHAAVKARVLSSQTVFAKPSRHCYSSKRGAIIRPQAQYSSGGGPPEGNKKLSTGDIVTIGGEVLTRTLTQERDHTIKREHVHSGVKNSISPALRVFRVFPELESVRESRTAVLTHDLLILAILTIPTTFVNPTGSHLWRWARVLRWFVVWRPDRRCVVGSLLVLCKVSTYFTPYPEQWPRGASKGNMLLITMCSRGLPAPCSCCFYSLGGSILTGLPMR
eukprot:1191746-Prorocentrum_minimum.AAC.1